MRAVYRLTVERFTRRSFRVQLDGEWFAYSWTPGEARLQLHRTSDASELATPNVWAPTFERALGMAITHLLGD